MLSLRRFPPTYSEYLKSDSFYYLDPLWLCFCCLLSCFVLFFFIMLSHLFMCSLIFIAYRILCLKNCRDILRSRMVLCSSRENFTCFWQIARVHDQFQIAFSVVTGIEILWSRYSPWKRWTIPCLFLLLGADLRDPDPKN